jgi:hypothetical protein
MRHALSLLTGIAVAAACVLFLHQASSLSQLALAGCGVGICLLTRTWAFNLPAVRRGAVRLRILWRRHAPVALPAVTLAEAGPFVRRQVGRVNLMWLSYALIAGWAVYEMLDGPRFTTAPIERAAAGASSAMDAVAGTSAAIRALSAVGDAAATAPRDRAGGITAAALPAGQDVDRAVVKAEGRGQVMGVPAEPRTGDAGCATSSMLEALLPDAPVKEF